MQRSHPGYGWLPPWGETQHQRPTNHAEQAYGYFSLFCMWRYPLPRRADVAVDLSTHHSMIVGLLYSNTCCLRSTC